MDKLRIRVRWRDAEFEAEGRAPEVRRQLDDFKAWAAPLAAEGPAAPSSPTASAQTAANTPLLYDADRALGTLTLRVIPSTDQGVLRQTANTLLLALHGHHRALGRADIGVVEAARCIRQSGLVGVRRLSNAFQLLQNDGLALKTGAGKGTKYRLSVKGMAAAEALIRQTLSRAGLA